MKLDEICRWGDEGPLNEPRYVYNMERFLDDEMFWRKVTEIVRTLNRHGILR